MMNNINIHAYMKTMMNVVFMHMHAKKGINFFGEISIAEMIK